MWTEDTIKPATEDEETQIRSEIPHVITGSGQKCKRLHIPDVDSAEPKPACNDTHLKSSRATKNWTDAEWMQKSKAVYPVGYCEICKNCVKLWRHDDL